MVQRILLGGVTVAVLLWVGVLLRDQRLGNPAADRLAPRPGAQPPQGAAHAGPGRPPPPAHPAPPPGPQHAPGPLRVRRGRWLDPDPTWDLKLATGLFVQRRPAASLAVALPAARHEPANLDLWNIVARAGARADPRAARLAAAETLRHNSPA